jgi:hypothetical protein
MRQLNMHPGRLNYFLLGEGRGQAPIIFSLCSHQVPNDTLNVFPKFWCVSQVILNSATFYPISFA